MRWIKYHIMNKYKNLCPILVERFSQDSVCTLSRIYFDDMVFYGLEPAKPIVEDGRYLLTLTHSPRFSGKYPYNKYHDSNLSGMALGRKVITKLSLIAIGIMSLTEDLDTLPTIFCDVINERLTSLC